VPPSSYPFLAVVLLAVGLLFTAIYFMYQMKEGKKNILFELLIGLGASGVLGFGTLFLMLSFGLYV
jgi:hypothetical protein